MSHDVGSDGVRLRNGTSFEDWLRKLKTENTLIIFHFLAFKTEKQKQFSKPKTVIQQFLVLKSKKTELFLKTVQKQALGIPRRMKPLSQYSI